MLHDKELMYPVKLNTGGLDFIVKIDKRKAFPFIGILHCYVSYGIADKPGVKVIELGFKHRIVNIVSLITNKSQLELECSILGNYALKDNGAKRFVMHLNTSALQKVDYVLAKLNEFIDENIIEEVEYTTDNIAEYLHEETIDEEQEIVEPSKDAPLKERYMYLVTKSNPIDDDVVSSNTLKSIKSLKGNFSKTSEFIEEYRRLMLTPEQPAEPPKPKNLFEKIFGAAPAYTQPKENAEEKQKTLKQEIDSVCQATERDFNVLVDAGTKLQQNLVFIEEHITKLGEMVNEMNEQVASYGDDLTKLPMDVIVLKNQIADSYTDATEYKVKVQGILLNAQMAAADLSLQIPKIKRLLKRDSSLDILSTIISESMESLNSSISSTEKLQKDTSEKIKKTVVDSIQKRLDNDSTILKLTNGAERTKEFSDTLLEQSAQLRAKMIVESQLSDTIMSQNLLANTSKEIKSLGFSNDEKAVHS